MSIENGNGNGATPISPVPDKQQQVQITPVAILAAILFNLNKTETIKVPVDDSVEEVEVQAPCVGIEQTDEAIVCIIPMDKIIHFAINSYDFQFRVEQGIAVVSFEKHVFTGADLYAANGSKVAKQSEVIKELLEKLK